MSIVFLSLYTLDNITYYYYYYFLNEMHILDNVEALNFADEWLK